eukprot:m.143396 g.143396  ORF g.143396 m.143396 type:complete len:1711 (-) comp14093_c1_seq1:93-5225(-)
MSATLRYSKKPNEPPNPVPVKAGAYSRSKLSEICGFVCTSVFHITARAPLAPNADGEFVFEDGHEYVAMLKFDQKYVAVSCAVDPKDIARCAVCIDNLDARPTQETKQLLHQLGGVDCARTIEHASLPCTITRFDDAVVVALNLTEKQHIEILQAPEVDIPQLHGSGNQAGWYLAECALLDTLRKVVSSDRSDDDVASERRLVFTGRGLSGSVAHLAACVVRHCAGKEPFKSLSCVSFGSPSLLDRPAARYTSKHFSPNHLSFFHTTDCVVKALLQGLLSPDLSPELAMNLAKTTLAGRNQPLQLDPLPLHSDSYCLFGLVRIGQHGDLSEDTTRAMGLICSIAWSSPGCVSHTQTALKPASVDPEFQGNASTLPSLNLCPKFETCFILDQQVSVILSIGPGAFLEPLQLRSPTTERQTVDIQECIRPAGQRPVRSCPVLFDGHPESDAYFASADSSQGAPQVCVTRYADASCRVMLHPASIQCLPRTIQIVTDFGISDALAISEKDVMSDSKPQTAAANSDVYRLLSTAIKRALMLDLHMRQAQTGGVVLSRLASVDAAYDPQPRSTPVKAQASVDKGKDGAEVHLPIEPLNPYSEHILSLVTTIVTRTCPNHPTEPCPPLDANDGTDNCPANHILRKLQAYRANPCHSQMQLVAEIVSRELQPIEQAFMEDLELEIQSSKQKKLRTLFRWMGIVGAGLCMLVGGVLVLPSAIAFAATGAPWLKSAKGEMHAVHKAAAIPLLIAASPGAAFLSAGIALYAGASKLANPPSQHYSKMIEFLLKVLCENLQSMSDSTPALESKLFSVIDANFYGVPPQEVGEDDILSFFERRKQQMAEKRATSDDKARQMLHTLAGPVNNPLAVFKDLSQLAKWSFIAHRMHMVRTIVERDVIIPFIGVHNAGKSTSIRALFDIETNPDSLIRTEEVGMFPLEAKSFGLEVDQQKNVFVVDMPGATDERASIARMTENFIEASTLTVVMLRAGHIAGPEKRIVDIARGTGAPFMIIINKVDAMPDLLADPQRYRRHYAHDLEVPTEAICFAQMTDDMSVQTIRRTLMTAVCSAVSPDLRPTVLYAMLHPKVKALLASVPRLHSMSGEEGIANHMFQYNYGFGSMSVYRASLEYCAMVVQESRQLDAPPVELQLAAQVAAKTPYRQLLARYMVLALVIARENKRFAASHQPRVQLESTVLAVIDALEAAQAGVQPGSEGDVVGDPHVQQAIQVLFKQCVALSEELASAGLSVAYRIQHVVHFVLGLGPPDVEFHKQVDMRSGEKDLDVARSTVSYLPFPGLPTRMEAMFAAHLESGISYSERAMKALARRQQVLQRDEETDALGLLVFAEADAPVQAGVNDSVKQLVRNLGRQTKRQARSNQSAQQQCVSIFHALFSNASRRDMVRSTGLHTILRTLPTDFVYFNHGMSDDRNEQRLLLRGVGRILGMILVSQLSQCVPYRYPCMLPLALFKMLLGEAVRAPDLQEFDQCFTENQTVQSQLTDDELIDNNICFSPHTRGTSPISVACAGCIGRTNKSQTDDSWAAETAMTDIDGRGSTQGHEQVLPETFLRFLSEETVRMFHRDLPLEEVILGFHDIVPPHAAALLTAHELQWLICSGKRIVAKQVCECFRPVDREQLPTQESMDRLFQVLAELSEEELRCFSTLATGNCLLREDTLIFYRKGTVIAKDGGHLFLPEFSSLTSCRNAVQVAIRPFVFEPKQS